MDLHGRSVVDAAIDLICSYLFLRDGLRSERKVAAARRWIHTRLPRIQMLRERILSGDRSTMTDFEIIAGPPLIEE